MATVRYIFISILLLLLTGCAAGPTFIREQVEQGNYEQALEKGRRYLDSHPDDWQTRRYVGDAAWEMGDSAQAYDIWKPAARLYITEQPRLGRRLVRLAIDRGDYVLADELLGEESAFSGSELLRADREEMSVVVHQVRIQALWDVQRGDSAVVRGDWQMAWQFYQRAAETYSQPSFSAREKCLQAWHLIETPGSGYTGKAEILLVEALKLAPDQPVIRYLTGSVWEKMGRRSDALRDFLLAATMGAVKPWSSLAQQALEEIRLSGEQGLSGDSVRVIGDQ